MNVRVNEVRVPPRGVPLNARLIEVWVADEDKLRVFDSIVGIDGVMAAESDAQEPSSGR